MTEPFLDEARGGLRMEGVPLAELVQRLGTPFFLISASRLRANYHALERGLAAAGPGTVLRYCAKTNSEAAVLEVMGALGSHLLASHAAEAVGARRVAEGLGRQVWKHRLQHLRTDRGRGGVIEVDGGSGHTGKYPSATM